MKLHFFLYLIFVSTLGFAQNSKSPAEDSCTITLTDTIHVSGVILDSSNKPVQNVNIHTKRQYFGVSTMTDSMGRFRLENVQPTDTIFVEISYFEKRIPNNGSRFLKIFIPPINQSANNPYIIKIERSAVTEKKAVVSNLSGSCSSFFHSFGIYPEFPGGNRKLSELIKANLVYPKKALLENLEGEVVVQFIISKDGTPKDFIISSGLSKECDEAAVNALKRMPKWKMGIFYGRPIEHPVSIAVQFAIIR